MAESISRVTALHAFGTVIALYQELNTSSGGLGAINYAQGAEAGKATNTGSSQTVQPSSSDFICDVEIAARRCLSGGDLAYFHLYYKSGDVVVQTMEQIEDVDFLLEGHIQSFPESKQAAVRSIDTRVRELLGRRCIEIGICPPSKYLAAVDVRAERKPKIRWSHLY